MTLIQIAVLVLTLFAGGMGSSPAPQAALGPGGLPTCDGKTCN